MSSKKEFLKCATKQPEASQPQPVTSRKAKKASAKSSRKNLNASGEQAQAEALPEPVAASKVSEVDPRVPATTPPVQKNAESFKDDTCLSVPMETDPLFLKRARESTSSAGEDSSSDWKTKQSRRNAKASKKNQTTSSSSSSSSESEGEPKRNVPVRTPPPPSKTSTIDSSSRDTQKRLVLGEVTAKACYLTGLINSALRKPDNPAALQRGFDGNQALSELVHQLTAHCAHLEGRLAERSDAASIAPRDRTFASVLSQNATANVLVAPAAQAKKVTIRAPQKVLFIKPKESAGLKSVDEAKLLLMRTFNPQKEKVKIRNVRKTKVGLVVETETESDLEKLEKSKKLNEKFEIERPRKKLPRVIIYDVPKELNESDLVKVIFDQNRDLAKSAEDLSKVLLPKFKTGKKDAEAVNWVCEATPETRCKLISAKKVFVGWLACKVQDFVLVTRCFKCQGHGHIAKHCDKPDTCSFCAQTGHKSTECPSKGKPRKCVNCERGKKASNHDVMDKKCPFYQAALNKLINSIDYAV